MRSTVLSQVSELVSQGEIVKSIETLKTQLQNFGQKYSIFSNLGALYLQQGEIQNATQQFTKAISLDPFSYIAYYNRFLCFYTNNLPIYAWNDLRKSLSCLYMQKGYAEKNIKYLNKSIFYCEKNAKAYLYRTKMNEGKSIKIIENDYEAAIQYCPNLAEIYQQRALFYRKNKKMRQFQENLQIYNSLKNLRKTHANQLGDNDQNNESQNLNYRQKIEQGVKELFQLLHKNQYPFPISKYTSKESQISKLPLDSLQSNMQQEKEEKNLLNSQRDNEPESSQTLEIKKELISFKKSTEVQFSKNFRQIFQDENSDDLNKEIDNIERQIMADGGRLSLGQEINDQLDISDPSNFLTKEIQKTIEQIQEFCEKQMLSDVKSVKSLRSNGQSKLHQHTYITMQDFNKHTSIKIQFLELHDLQDSEKKQQAKIEFIYKNEQYETSISRYQWNEQHTIAVEKDIADIEVKAVLKGGIFKASSEIGEGTIDLLDINETKCLLGNKERKTAILYFRISLI